MYGLMVRTYACMVCMYLCRPHGAYVCYLRSKRLYRTGNSFIEHFTAIADPSALKLCKAFNTHMHTYMYLCLCVCVCVSAWAGSSAHSVAAATAAAASTFSLALAKRGVKIATIFWLPSGSADKSTTRQKVVGRRQTATRGRRHLNDQRLAMPRRTVAT